MIRTMICRTLRPCLLAASALLATSAQAGGGPENVFLVVNQRSWASKTIANYFVDFRGVPSDNVFYIDWGAWHTTDVNSFRRIILEPVLETIQKRQLTSQIDYIVYSADIPYSVFIGADVGEYPLGQAVGRYGATSGLTYLHALVRTKTPAYLGFATNLYRQQYNVSSGEIPTQGFRATRGWGDQGRPLPQGGIHYMLSVMLGVTHGRGNSPQEVVRYLQRAARADGTRPQGTIYYMNNADVRTRARRFGNSSAQGTPDEFARAVAQLQELGVRAAIIDGVLPSGVRDVAGLMTGAMKFDWPSSRSTILPGAICENFTSWGGVFDDAIDEQGVASQTPLSVFLRYGAAGSSGTVSEPMSFQNKFPVAAMHVHYARGCSLAEAFYQSVSSPWQLLIVGDPLCRPWAAIPDVSLSGIEQGATLSGRTQFVATADNPGGYPVDRIELFVDGKRTAVAAAGAPIELDTTTLADGYHELRVVAVESGPIETQGGVHLGVIVDNRGRKLIAASRPAGEVALGSQLQLGGKCEGASAITFWHGGRELGRVPGEIGSFSIDSAILGQGPVTIRAVALGPGGEPDFAVAAPLRLNVLPPAPRPPVALPGGIRLRNGLLMKFGSSQIPLEDTTKPNWFSATGIAPGQDFTVQGYFGAATEDMYQFRVGFSGNLTMRVDGSTVLDGKDRPFENHFVPLSLAKGTHRVEIRGRTAKANPMFELSFGGPVDGVRAVDGRRFQHVE